MIQPLSHLQQLEADSIQVLREVVAECRRPVLLTSLGKDSAVLLHLARKAFHPGPLPFPLLHVDTTWKFRAMYAMRDAIAALPGVRMIVHRNPQAVAQGINPFDHGPLHTDLWKTEGLKQALAAGGFDAAFGGARRDEDASRAKERVLSFRSAEQHWDPRNQRPELWRLYNARIHPGESLRAFPLSDWTELDVWHYIRQERIELVPLYFAAPRPVVERDGVLVMVDDARMQLRPGEQPVERMVRFRTLGCYPLTGAVPSTATDIEQIITEIAASRGAERQGRIIDREGSGATGGMERRKREGYF